jgi:hypothetical protein
MCLYGRVSEYSFTVVVWAGNVICKVNICLGTKEQMTVTYQATCFVRKYEVVDLRSIDLSPKTGHSPRLDSALCQDSR